MRWLSIVLVALVVTFGAAAARAQVIYNNFGAGDTYGGTGVNPTILVNAAAPFTPSADVTADSFTIFVAMSNTSANDAQINLTLANGTAQTRPGSAIATGTVLVPVGANQVFELTLTPAAAATLTGNRQYWIVAVPVLNDHQATWMLNSTGATGYASTLPTGSWVVNTNAPTPSLRVVANTQGACCAGATCTVVSSDSCTGAGTRFIGAGSACNPAGNHTAPCCAADYDQNGAVSVQDIFTFLADWFAGSPRADINGGGIAVQDIFDFLSAWFAGC